MESMGHVFFFFLEEEFASQFTGDHVETSKVCAQQLLCKARVAAEGSKVN